MIPARLIQTCRSEYLLPPVFRRCRDSLRHHHRDFEYTCFADDAAREFISKRRPEYLDLFDFYPRNVQRADLFRLLAVHELGGFYLDLDVYCHRPMDSLLRHNLVFPLEQELGSEEFEQRFFRPPSSPGDLAQLGNYAFGAEQGHWFLARILDEMVDRAGMLDTSRVTDEDVLYSTGPDVLNTAFQRHREELEEDLTILVGLDDPPSPKPPFRGRPHWHQFGCYGNHLINGSWRGGH